MATRFGIKHATSLASVDNRSMRYSIYRRYATLVLHKYGFLHFNSPKGFATNHKQYLYIITKNNKKTMILNTTHETNPFFAHRHDGTAQLQHHKNLKDIYRRAE